MINYNKRLDTINEYRPSERVYGTHVKKLDWNECTLPLDPKFHTILNTALSGVALCEYPSINNDELLHYLSLHCGVDSCNIQTFNGSDSALHYIFAAFLNPSTNVLIYYPNYSQIETYIKMYSNNLNYSAINFPFNEHIYDFNDILNNDVVYISNPNNPTGAVIEPSVIKILLEMYPNKLFIIDEAYYEFSGKTCASFIKEHDNIIVTRTFSKALSLASIRLGYICANENIINIINKIRNTKEVNTVAQTLGLVALKNYNFIQNRIDTIIQTRTLFENHLSNNNITYIKSSANFVLLKTDDSKRTVQTLLNNHILVRDRGMYKGLENTIRVTIGQVSDMNTIINTIVN